MSDKPERKKQEKQVVLTIPKALNLSEKEIESLKGSFKNQLIETLGPKELGCVVIVVVVVIIA